MVRIDHQHSVDDIQWLNVARYLLTYDFDPRREHFAFVEPFA